MAKVLQLYRLCGGRLGALAPRQLISTSIQLCTISSMFCLEVEGGHTSQCCDHVHDEARQVYPTAKLSQRASLGLGLYEMSSQGGRLPSSGQSALPVAAVSAQLTVCTAVEAT